MDFLNSFFQNIKDKLTSPFFGTLSFILLIHHWIFWYTLLNFDSGTRLNVKVHTLQTVGSNEFTPSRLLLDFGWAALVMLGGYLIVLVTRSLSLLIDFRTMPWITGQIISKNVVERKLHEEVLTERDEYAEKYEEQRRLVRKYSVDYDAQVEEAQNKNSQIKTLNATITNLNTMVGGLNTDLASKSSELVRLQTECSLKENDIVLLNAQVSTLKRKIVILEADMDQYHSLFFSNENQLFYTSGTKFPPTVLQLVEKLKADQKWETFKHVAKFARYAGTIGVELYPMMEPYGIIVPGTEKLTAIGRILTRYYELFENETGTGDKRLLLVD